MPITLPDSRLLMPELLLGRKPTGQVIEESSILNSKLLYGYLLNANFIDLARYADGVRNGITFNGGFASFNGTSDYFTIGTEFTNYMKDNVICVTCRFRYTESTFRALMGSINSGTNTMYQLYVNGDATGDIGIYARSETGNADVLDGNTNPGLNDGKWHTVTAIANAPEGELEFWIDGVQSTTVYGGDNGVITGTVKELENPMPIGCRNSDGTLNSYLDCDIESIFIHIGKINNISAFHRDLYQFLKPRHF